MKMAYDEDQQLMQKTAREFVTGQSPVSRMRALRDSGDAVGYSPELWKEMAQPRVGRSVVKLDALCGVEV